MEQAHPRARRRDQGAGRGGQEALDHELLRPAGTRILEVP
jgi:hypothetical protein